MRSRSRSRDVYAVIYLATGQTKYYLRYYAGMTVLQLGETVEGALARRTRQHKRLEQGGAAWMSCCFPETVHLEQKEFAYSKSEASFLELKVFLIVFRQVFCHARGAAYSCLAITETIRGEIDALLTLMAQGRLTRDAVLTLDVYFARLHLTDVCYACAKPGHYYKGCPGITSERREPAREPGREPGRGLLFRRHNPAEYALQGGPYWHTARLHWTLLVPPARSTDRPRRVTVWIVQTTDNPERWYIEGKDGQDARTLLQEFEGDEAAAAECALGWHLQLINTHIAKRDYTWREL